MIAYPNVKLNVGLRVLRRRPDGYHDLDTLFIPYPGFHDTLEIVTGDDYSRTSAHLQETYAGAQRAQGITPDGKLMITIARKEGVDWDPLKDLTARAYGLLAEQYKLPPMKIFLEKTSPVGAGLGGGSADAAFALRMIAELAGLALSDAELAALAVPEGIAVSTADAYRGIVPNTPEVPLRDILARPVEEWKGRVVNDFETTVFAKYPRLAEIKQSLYDAGAVYAAMSGSGSALFALYRD